ncbi:hypothetical protein LGH82_04225 [Mesorhizobium sp. PAMC28654]|nr:hypothetical protein [Mesorhizobium sp. PAMC28654]UDL90568.1 hypothetical protein LGH82_04225 [Mesorhizobium sp. PAMC28654]
MEERLKFIARLLDGEKMAVCRSGGCDWASISSASSRAARSKNGRHERMHLTSP